MIQEMHERLKKANERRNCGADDEIASLREALAAKDAEIERLRADAALGRAVRNMPQDTDLYRALWKWVVAREAEAIRAAGLMEGDE